MDQRETRILRLRLLAVFLVAAALLYLGLLYNTQIINHDYYLTQSLNTIAKEEKVVASRGIITDRSGRELVSNRSTYNLTFDSSLLRGADENQAILRLVELCRDNGVVWTDNLPISQSTPYTYAVDALSTLQKERFLTYLKNLKFSKNALGDYLLQHPEVLAEEESAPVEGGGETAAEEDPATKTAKLLDRLTSDALTSQLLADAGITSQKLMDAMRESFHLSGDFSSQESRFILGVQYELALRKLNSYTAYILAEDIDTAFISLLSDGGFAGASITSSTVREYETAYAAHILGTVGPIWRDEYQALKSQGYRMDDTIGKSGVELAFEEYLKGTDGRRIISTNSDGKTTGEFYKQEPEPGNTVELTIDLSLQQAVEDALAETVTAMNEKDGETSRGAGATVVKVGTGEVLALASYPTYDLSTYNQLFNTLSSDPATPLVNRATQGTYAPGSTFKPLTAIAALTEGVITPYQKLKTLGHWTYPGDPNSYANCWLYNATRGNHGSINVSEAITVSCNYFFAEMGYRLGLDTLNQYAKAFGLGVSTGIEIGDRAGNLAENQAGENQAPWAAFGQASYLFSPIQLSNYIATLVSGGKHCEAHLLKAVKSYDNTQVVAVGNTEPTNVVEISPENLEAVKAGMHALTTTGSLSSYFKDCVVDAGAKTGTAQISKETTNNGVFVCFAPYDNPEIALSIVIERGGSGSALATAAVKILNAYFAPDEIGTAVIGENQLLP